MEFREKLICIKDEKSINKNNHMFKIGDICTIYCHYNGDLIYINYNGQYLGLYHKENFITLKEYRNKLITEILN